MLGLININEQSKVPKYQQIINSILTAIENREVKMDDKLPSVNQLLIEFDISRDTIVRAYDHLKEIGIIESVPGKGYYIKKDKLALKARVFLLFNKLSAHKKVIYDSFAATLGDYATVDFFIYDNNYRHFKELILGGRNRDYSHYVIIAHFDEGGDGLAEFIKQEIPQNKLIVLDKKIDGLGGKVASVCQDFEANIYNALAELQPQLAGYSCIKLLFGRKSYQPLEIRKGFVRFCGEYNYDFGIVEAMEEEAISPKTVYINLKEDDLVTLIKKIKQTPFRLGSDVGIISYNDTPLKEVLLDGITAISTDFHKLGEQAALMILNRQKQQFDNPFYVIPRNSL
jgi:DNA-binding transcriptional regulator YhcF (GntR family)